MREKSSPHQPEGERPQQKLPTRRNPFGTVIGEALSYADPGKHPVSGMAFLVGATAALVFSPAIGHFPTDKWFEATGGAFVAGGILGKGIESLITLGRRNNRNS